LRCGFEHRVFIEFPGPGHLDPSVNSESE